MRLSSEAVPSTPESVTSPLEVERGVDELRLGDCFRLGGNLYVFGGRIDDDPDLIQASHVYGSNEIKKSGQGRLRVHSMDEYLNIRGHKLFVRPLLTQELSDQFLQDFVF